MIFLYVFLLIAVFSVLMAVLMKWTVRIAGKTIAGRVDYLHRKAQFLIETGAFHPEWIRKGVGARPYPEYRRFLRKEFRSLTRYFKRTPVFEDAQAGRILMEKLGSLEREFCSKEYYRRSASAAPDAPPPDSLDDGLQSQSK